MFVENIALMCSMIARIIISENRTRNLSQPDTLILKISVVLTAVSELYYDYWKKKW